jgi:multidrug transporter EmrE-like cation transporter
LGAGAVLFGKPADDYGARRVILGGILLMAAGFFGMSLSLNVLQLSLTYGLMVGLAMGACGLAIASLSFRKLRPGSPWVLTAGWASLALLRSSPIML